METNVDTLSLSRETPVKRKYDGTCDDESEDGRERHQPASWAPGEDSRSYSATPAPATGEPPATTRQDLGMAHPCDEPPSSTLENEADVSDGPGNKSDVGLCVDNGAKVASASAVGSESKQQQGQANGSKTSGGRKGKGKQRGNSSRTVQPRGGGEQGVGSSMEVPGGREAPEKGRVGSTEYVKITQYSTEREVIAEVEECEPVTISKGDKASQVQLSNDKLTMKSQKGYRMARATHGVREGCWYFEITIEHLGETGHARCGWCTSKADIQAPVGSDQYGFAYRDLEGAKVHKGIREAYSDEYTEGDVLGFYIYLPAFDKPEVPGTKPELFLYKGSTYKVEQPEKAPEPLLGSMVAFSKNGKMLGVAFRDIIEGTYFPAASLYTQPNPAKLAEVRFNFGPDFIHPPVAIKEGLPVPKPISEIASPPQIPPTNNVCATAAQSDWSDEKPTTIVETEEGEKKAESIQLYASTQPNV
eukprot:CAMPEP_0118930446 /NCGR_PEP_ID=MMETSP1169-20130426/7130_1 /TAXON_ID=36882 /ORGANISM="Pyramimonas obovata, Strain CCMP722" /LENGTH=473 /DNA_ID=CAMNT_0006872805 /DNA_START=10 /DNA_END=1431 /DNA_ORIENTATION=-